MIADNECTQDEPCDGPDQYVIVLTDSGRYKTAFHVARVYYGPIIGAKGQNRKRLEDETKTIIRVPRHPQDQDIVITGSSRGAVAAARRRIEMTVMSYRSKQQATHFISIPMINPEVKARLNEFKDIVLKDYRTRGVDESIFQNPEKLHLTLCTMVLNDNFERSEAVRVMESCKRDVIDWERERGRERERERGRGRELPGVRDQLTLAVYMTESKDSWDSMSRIVISIIRKKMEEAQ
ncbi:activating signal cointegrator 1 complex subunit [Homalodisca vitripennis]|nr:activating signal cointegrator 1 complex subunit [Homalodisca vitripennis]